MQNSSFKTYAMDAETRVPFLNTILWPIKKEASLHARWKIWLGNLWANISHSFLPNPQIVIAGMEHVGRWYRTDMAANQPSTKPPLISEQHEKNKLQIWFSGTLGVDSGLVTIFNPAWDMGGGGRLRGFTIAQISFCTGADCYSRKLLIFWNSRNYDVGQFEKTICYPKMHIWSGLEALMQVQFSRQIRRKSARMALIFGLFPLNLLFSGHWGEKRQKTAPFKRFFELKFTGKVGPVSTPLTSLISAHFVGANYSFRTWWCDKAVRLIPC